MWRKRLTWVLVGLLLAVAGLQVARLGHWQVHGLRNHEHFYHGRPTSYYEMALGWQPAPQAVGWLQTLCRPLDLFTGDGSDILEFRTPPDPARTDVLLELYKRARTWEDGGRVEHALPADVLGAMRR